MSGEYSVVFTGKVLEGLDLKLVKSNLAEKLKLSADQVTQLFESAPQSIKKYDSNDDAEKLIAIFKSCGAVCTVDIAIPDWELVDDEAQENRQSFIDKIKSRGPTQWIATLILPIVVALSIYILLG